MNDVFVELIYLIRYFNLTVGLVKLRVRLVEKKDGRENVFSVLSFYCLISSLLSFSFSLFLSYLPSFTLDKHIFSANVSHLFSLFLSSVSLSVRPNRPNSTKSFSLLPFSLISTKRTSMFPKI